MKPYYLAAEPANQFARLLISEIRQHIGRIVEQPNLEARFKLNREMEDGVHHMCLSQLEWYEKQFQDMNALAVDALNRRPTPPFVIPATKRRIAAVTGWKYKWILEYDPRLFRAWEISLRRELKRHL